MPFRVFRPTLAGARLPERVAACLGAAAAIAIAAWLPARLGLSAADVPAIVAPIGASAVLAFAVPASPLAQPWSVVGGNVVATLVGVAAFRAIPDATLAAGAAVGCAILAMSLLRCLHPPGGAAALFAVIGGPGVHAAGYGFALVPVAVNSLILVAAAMLFHRTTGRSYPHRPALDEAPAAAFLAEDVDAALADMHEGFDIAREDLAVLLARAEAHAVARRGRTSRPVSRGRARQP